MEIVKTAFNCKVVDIKPVFDEEDRVVPDLYDIFICSDHEEYKSFYGTDGEGRPKPLAVRVDKYDAQQIALNQDICYRETNVMVGVRDTEEIIQTKGDLSVLVRYQVCDCYDEIQSGCGEYLKVVRSENLSPRLTSEQGVTRNVYGPSYSSRGVSTSFQPTKTSSKDSVPNQ